MLYAAMKNNRDTTNEINMSAMFAYCDSLVEVDLSNSNLKNADLSRLFLQCQSLETVNFENSNLEGSNLAHMFDHCENLNSLNFSKVKAAETSFYGTIFWNYWELIFKRLEELVFT